MLFTRRAEAVEREAGAPGRVLARGERTLLCEFTRRDVDRWLEWPRHTDPLFDDYNPPSMTERQRDLYFDQRRHATDSRQYAVEHIEGDLVGRISLRDLDWRVGAGVLGISFHPRRLGHGLGTDSLRAFLHYYFEGLGLQTLFLDVAAFNKRAYRVYEKCGFRPTGQRWGRLQSDTAGVFRREEYASIRHLFHHDRGFIHPLLIDMVLRREEWEQARASR